MKRKVVYIRVEGSINIGHPAIVVPLNHTSDWVTNGHTCVTTAVQSIAEDGTTFETKNSIYVLAAPPCADEFDTMLGDAHPEVHGQTV